LPGSGRYRFSSIAHIADNLDQAVIHILERLQQLACFIPGCHLDVAGEIAGCHGLGNDDSAIKRPHDGARQQEG